MMKDSTLQEAALKKHLAMQQKLTHCCMQDAPSYRMLVTSNKLALSAVIASHFQHEMSETPNLDVIWQLPCVFCNCKRLRLCF